MRRSRSEIRVLVILSAGFAVLFLLPGFTPGGGTASSSSRTPRGIATGREVAITFDDLPGVSVAGGDAAERPAAQDLAWAAMTRRLLEALVRARVPVVGFVNSGKLVRDGSAVPARTELLRSWRDAGFELGNHTAGHVDRHRVPLAEFEADVVSGETAVQALEDETSGAKRLRWFRHPFLHTGRTLEEKRALESFLAQRGYRIAPVTIDNSE